MTIALTTTDLQKLQAQTRTLFSALYVLDVDTLNDAQRAQHQQQLAAAHAALVKLENTRLENLNAQATQQLAALQLGLQHMQAELDGADKPLDVMAAVGGVMDNLVGVVKGGV